MAGRDRAQQVLAPPARAAIFLVVTVHEGSEGDVRDTLADVPGLVRSVAFRHPDDRLTCVVGLGADLWDRAYDAPRPGGLHRFRQLEGPRHVAVSTPGDLLFHLRADRMDLCFELSRQIMLALAGHVEVVDEVHGFRYFDERDLLGFVDGTENPSLPADAIAATLIGDDDVYAGGSFVIVQKYLHDLDAWEALSVEEQERVIGRTKLSDIELPDDVKPADSHVALNTIEDPDGTEQQIVRDNMAFGAVGTGEFGTYFIGYAARPDVTEQMLENMFLGDPPGNTDRILDFSTAVTGTLFFVPPEDFLEDPEELLAAARAGSEAQGADDDHATAPPADGSLGIGSLRTKEGTS